MTGQKIDILFAIMAVQEVKFFAPIAKRLMKEEGLKVAFLTFHETGDDILEKAAQIISDIKGDSNIKFIYNPVWFKAALFIFYITFITSMVAALLIFVYQRYLSRNAA